MITEDSAGAGCETSLKGMEFLGNVRLGPESEVGFRLNYKKVPAFSVAQGNLKCFDLGCCPANFCSHRKAGQSLGHFVGECTSHIEIHFDL